MEFREIHLEIQIVNIYNPNQLVTLYIVFGFVKKSFKTLLTSLKFCVSKKLKMGGDYEDYQA